MGDGYCYNRSISIPQSDVVCEHTYIYENLRTQVTLIKTMKVCIEAKRVRLGNRRSRE